MTRKPAWERHQKDEDGDHEPEECYACLLKQEVTGECPLRRVLQTPDNRNDRRGCRT